ncbi:MAG: oligoendopeptidase F [Firmicutes bacterium]|nr:oligoendopeptidase F [Bacillota bacterium]MDY5770345.1 oligoendopeptidase F [Anaerovoracaceae bacterium]
MTNNNTDKDKTLKQREQIPNEYKWDIEAMYPDETAWDRDVADSIKAAEDFKRFQGRVTESADTLYEALSEKDVIWKKLEHAYVYAAMRKDEDNRVTKYQTMDDKCGSALAKASAAMSFFAPELLAAPEEKILSFIEENPKLKQYEFVLKDALREKKHVLTASEENILAQLSEVTGATNDVFKMLNNADMNFGTIVDEDGDTVNLTHGNYITFMESHDRNVRKAAFTNMYEAYKALINTIAVNYNYNVKTDVVSARIRKYSSARQAALSGGNIPEEVYDNLISVVHEYLPVLYRYIALRKKVLGVDELKMYDVYVPLVQLPKRDIPYEEALKMMQEGLAPLGDEYLAQVDRGTKEGWIDVYENQGKTSGAYSFGSYDSKPYILLNYTNTLKDVFTIVHEMGHSMHSYYTRKTQPYTYGDHSIFTAEVASTVNESLLMQHLLETEKDPEMKKYLINYYIEEFRTTLFRQTMFAEFELASHREVESGGVLTAQWLCETYDDLNRKYFGPALSEDEYIRYEWARIPHFYRGFYVYQYATGYSAATAISKKILTEGTEARDNYIEFLKSGSSDYPVELLKIAGVDMSSPEPIRMAMETFTSLVDQLEKLL